MFKNIYLYSNCALYKIMFSRTFWLYRFLWNQLCLINVLRRVCLDLGVLYWLINIFFRSCFFYLLNLLLYRCLCLWLQLNLKHWILFCLNSVLLRRLRMKWHTNIFIIIFICTGIDPKQLWAQYHRRVKHIIHNNIINQKKT